MIYGLSSISISKLTLQTIFMVVTGTNFSAPMGALGTGCRPRGGLPYTPSLNPLSADRHSYWTVCSRQLIPHLYLVAEKSVLLMLQKLLSTQVHTVSRQR